MAQVKVMASFRAPATECQAETAPELRLDYRGQVARCLRVRAGTQPA